MRYRILTLLPIALICTQLSAEPPLPDSSFLLEEAWRSDQAVIQHALSWNDGWTYAWTQEWSSVESPHLIGYTIPVTRNRGNDLELNEISLDYRWQLLSEQERGIAFSPRLSLILPLASSDDSIRYGLDLGLPVTVVRTPRFVIHSNLRASWSELESGGSIAELALGSSLVRALGSRSVGVLEAELCLIDSATDAGIRELAHELTVSPGLRHSIPELDELGITPGIAMPITVTEDDVSVSLLFHMMFEVAIGSRD